MKSSRSEFLSIRGMQYHIRHWGEQDAPVLFMLHGWMDVSATFQFVVDALQADWHVIAPDWRGFGLSEYAGSPYWFPDYLADLDAILRHYSPEQPVYLAGHSLGANVAGIYAGVRASRIRKLVMLEGFGMSVTQAEEAPLRYAKWLDEVQGSPTLHSYSSAGGVAARLQKNNPRLSDKRAEFLSRHWAAQNENGSWDILADAWHKLPNPNLYRVDEVMACWQAITAPTLWIEANDSELLRRMGSKESARVEIARRIAYLRDATILTVQDAGHMLQHDQPEIVAQAIEKFLD
jgi:pimeloyl-ACP methyl ester carboxylesterase